MSDGIININFDNVPDEILPIPAGIYTARVVGIPQIQPTKDGNGQKVVVEVEITEGDYAGRRVTDHISLKMTTRLKRLALSCGVTVGAGGLNLHDLADQFCQIQITTRPYTDRDTGEQKESYNIKDYLFAQS